MAKGKETKDDQDDVAEEITVTPPIVDGDTHAELRMLYADSTDTLRFVKSHQWKTVGATLITFLGLVIIAAITKAGPDLTNKLMALTILMSCAVVFTLIIYQLWMYNELAKLDHMQRYFSSAFKDVRAIKSRREGHIHRYTLLIFMTILIALGATVVHLAFQRIILL